MHATSKHLHLKYFYDALNYYCSLLCFWFCFYWLFMMMFVSSAYPTCFPLTQFTCNNGRCININWRCDNGELLTCFHLCCFCVCCTFSTDFPHLSLLIISCVFCVTSCPLLLTICPSPCVTWAVCCRKGLWGQLWWVQLSEPDRLVHRSTCTINVRVL